jgi:uncharacterized protein YndB with AHSA1/START domain
MNTNDEPLVVGQDFAAPTEVVWQAITEAEKMRQWFFGQIVEFKPELGFETQFDVEAEGRVFPHQWKVTEVEAGKKISYQCRYGGIVGNSMVTWELSELPEGTQLVFTHRVLEDFPQDDPMFNRESCEGGWDYFIRQNLTKFLGGVE